MLNININDAMENEMMCCERYIVIAVENADNWWIMGSASELAAARAILANERLDDEAGELQWYIVSPWGTLEEEG